MADHFYSGNIPVKINGAAAGNIQSITINEKVAARILRFTDGTRGVAQGTPEYDVSINAGIPKGRQVLLDQIDAAKATGEVTLSFETGGREYMLLALTLTGRSWNSDANGTADNSITAVSPELISIR